MPYQFKTLSADTVGLTTLAASLAAIH